MSNENQPRLLSFTLDGWDVLGGKVSVSLSDRVAVLVGRNGAGKSAILQGFSAIAFLAGGLGIMIEPVQQMESMPKVLDIEILTPTDRRLSYHYEIVPLKVNTEEINSDYQESQFSWNDHCQYEDQQGEVLWNTKTGVTDFEQEKRSIILGSMSTFIHYHRLKDIQYPPEMDWVSSLLKDVHVIGDTPINQSLQRYPSYLKTINNMRTLRGLADILSSNILTLHTLNPHLEEFDEFESICQRVGLANKITVETYSLEGGSKEDSTSYISSVLLDDVNIGLLSDGTLRVLSILLKIIRSSPTSTIIIEEPEIQIHPGMLSKILNEIESYTFGNNLIISTHSPQVVSWAKPHQISLIHRNNSRIFVRRLSSDEINRVIGYLSEDGDLGDWIYSGILDY